ncbi:MAG: hypothetical protein GVY26_11745 [Bacteroidetes bacterium]|jgi:hypothetical protein|nr:hypothetical protein [Bacteroidota bacterium]
MKAIITTLFLFITFLLAGQEGFQTRSIALFKNGLAFVQKSAQVDTDNEGRYRLKGNLPQARLGTFWVGAGTERFQSVRSYIDSVETKRTVRNIRETLELNIGKEAKLILPRVGGLDTLSGVLRAMEGDQLVFESAGQWHFLNANQIRQVLFEKKPAYAVEETTSKRVVEVAYAEPGKQKPLDLLYLTNEISWMPNYLLQIKDNGKAQLTLRGQVVNGLEKAVQTDLYFVVGVPNFRYSESVEPFLLLDAMQRPRSYNANLSRRNINALAGQFSNYQPVTYEEAYPARGNNPMGENLSGDAKEDLFFYELKGIDLAAGERAFYDILTLEVPFKHIYRVKLPAYKGNVTFASSRSDTQEDRVPVKHTLRLKNEGNTPWTTGTALILDAKEDRQSPISQDQLNYTPAGGTVYLPVTTATDVYVTETAVELNREAAAKRWGGHRYDLLTIEGYIKLQNFRSEAIQVELEKRITGELSKSSEQWQNTFIPNPRSSANRLNEVEWSLELEAGQEKEIVYTYELYVRNY